VALSRSSHAWPGSVHEKRVLQRAPVAGDSFLSGFQAVFLTGLQDIIHENERLAPHTWFNLGGPARWMARPVCLEQLVQLVERCHEAGVGVYRLGQGANLLIGDEGVDGMVIQLKARSFREVEWNDSGVGDSVLVRAGGGTDMNRLSRDAVNRGLAGLECMAGIPGTLGGIIRMNAGGRFGQISDTVLDVTVVDPQGGVRTLSHEEVGFRYRHTDLNGSCVCGASLQLRRDDPKRLRTRFLEYWQYKKRSQPLADFSAGCVFKNPPGHSAGQLIDRAGLKNRAVGGAYVSPAHGNFIVAREGATAGDVLALISVVRREVAERFGIELELEIEVWGHRHARSMEPVL
jgi:UDP-N-acetylmuramate dehydrogenase